MNLKESIVVRVDKPTKQKIMKIAKKKSTSLMRVSISDIIRGWIEKKLNDTEDEHAREKYI